MKLYNEKGGWSMEFKGFIDGLIACFSHEMGIDSTFSPEAQEIIRRVVENCYGIWPNPEVNISCPGLPLIPIKIEGDYSPAFKDSVYTCVKTVAKEGNLNSFLDMNVAFALIKAWVDMHPDAETCLLHRCELHKGIEQLNASAYEHAECGACILVTRVAGEKVNAAQQITQGGQLQNAPVHLLDMEQQVEVNALISHWAQRFKVVVQVGDTGYFPVIGEVFHRQEATLPCATFAETLNQLRHILMYKESFVGETLYMRTEPKIEYNFDFERRERVWRGMARWSFTVKSGTSVVVN